MGRFSETITYPAHAFYGEQRLSGTLFIGRASVCFKNDGHEVILPVEGSQVKLGGAGDRLVFFSHPSRPDWTLYTGDLKVLQDPALSDNADVRAQLHRANRRRQLNWSVLGMLMALLIALPLLLAVNFSALTGVAASQVPPKWERNLGESVFAQYRLTHTLVEDPQILERLDKLMAPLIAAADSGRYAFHVHLVEDPNINAFALPGGVIVLNSGLVLAAEQADEVLGVLAHEISHVTEQHGIRNVITSIGVYVTVQALLGDASGLLAVVGAATPLLINQSYSRGFEAEADDKGFELLRRANVDPSGLLRFFQRIREQERERLAKVENTRVREWLEDNMGILSSHPATEDRIHALEDRLRSSSADNYRDMSVEFVVFKQALKTVLVSPDVEEKQE